MAVGDVVADVVNTTGAAVDFQPAAGTEFCITSATSQDNSARIGIYDGTTVTNFVKSDIAPYVTNIKIFITNSHYLRLNSAGTSVMSYSGIQIK